MRDHTALTMIKAIHTIIWLAFNVVLFYLCYAVIINKTDQWVWIGIGAILPEGMILHAFQIRCPLTLIARKYSSSTKSNFDIYEWLAKNTKLIYTSFFTIIIGLLVYRMTTA